LLQIILNQLSEPQIHLLSGGHCLCCKHFRIPANQPPTTRNQLHQISTVYHKTTAYNDSIKNIHIVA
jgi:hypothetical protein